jgi:hypothetical protein
VLTLPDRRDREKELDLSKRWYAAMASCRPYFDDDHVYWMWHKSMYWLKDFDMPEEELTRLKIDLPTVREKVGEMVWWSDVKNHIQPRSDPPQEVNRAQSRLFSAKPKSRMIFDVLCRPQTKPSIADKSTLAPLLWGYIWGYIAAMIL